ncbi:MAG: hypothetical protein K2K46_01835 [Lachnospiraceae bacterium]|nr:hypothetical protein [Lachnospiraceae bacterium]
MAASWNVAIDGSYYNVEYINNNKVAVNGQKLKLKDYKVKTSFIQTEYDIPVGPKSARLVITTLKQPQLVIDGRDCVTGAEYVPIKIPIWSYIFIVLHCINFQGGAIGGALAAVGILATASVSTNNKMNIALKILINLAILIVINVILFGIEFIIRSLM